MTQNVPSARKEDVDLTIPYAEAASRVCVANLPYNVPAATAAATLIVKTAAVLMTRNLFIAEPYKKSPLSALALGPVFEKSGFPKGDFQVLPRDGSTGTYLANIRGLGW
ncbi:uncharacterized protein A1O5_04187 [Cladophialophora psammophila CBS 110553]|uniref:Aldehyde dehydrogenase domain-containing protein n=1 Tax=Cladophialophora psammophila CBS 110553 TaxID=1182543 RepID=W9WYL0_9EURO|nr:uncharacterized protein A1O5_04187 [Cladophialophora psammophila CBS 110553]EXJ73038.1 hypothetical protein A1O5_04187 [Cladophialophora psammophila CBS 110553]